MMRNPYENVDWNSMLRIPSLSHAHCTSDRTDRFMMYYEGGIRHFGISNYYPSEPYYPLADYYTGITIPSDAISCPNAEHHGLYLDGSWNSKLHINGVASFYSSNPTASDRGIDQPWQYCVDKIVQNLQFADGGGATINHPEYTNLNAKQIMSMLDYDTRVLGLEIINSYENNVALWDEILITGRRCFGFCVPDHDVETQGVNFRGRNILLCTEASEYECAKAYRQGRFYGAKYNTPLKFTQISLVNGTLTVNTENADNITIILDGVKTTTNGNSASMNIPPNATYVRAEARSADNEIYSQPIMMQDKKKSESKNIMMWYG